MTRKKNCGNVSLSVLMISDMSFLVIYPKGFHVENFNPCHCFSPPVTLIGIAVKLRTKLLMFGVYLARKDLWGL
jgi:predicted membrane protein